MVQIPFASFIWPTIKHRIGQHFIYVVKYYILACYINPCGDSTGMFTTMQRRLCVCVCVLLYCLKEFTRELNRFVNEPKLYIIVYTRI